MRSLLIRLLKDIFYTLVVLATTIGIGTAGYNYYFPRVSSIQRIKTLPLLGDVTRTETPKYKGVVILTDEKGVGFCSGSVIDNNYIVTAAHCLVEHDGTLNPKTLNVRTDDGTLIQVGALAAAVNTRVDVGLVIGNFKQFDFIPIDYKHMVDFKASSPMQSLLHAFNNAPLEESTPVITCGYPEAQPTLHCLPVKDVQYYEFQLIGHGQLFPGMSGGPVFVETLDGPKLVAVNTAITFEGGSNVIILSPVLGLQGEFDIY